MTQAPTPGPLDKAIERVQDAVGEDRVTVYTYPYFADDVRLILAELPAPTAPVEASGSEREDEEPIDVQEIDGRHDVDGDDDAKILAYEDAHSTVLDLGYPSLTEALEDLDRLKSALPVAWRLRPSDGLNNEWAIVQVDPTPNAKVRADLYEVEALYTREGAAK